MAVRFTTRGSWAACALVACALLTSAPAAAAPVFYSTGTHVANDLDLDWLVATGYGSFTTDPFVQAHTWAHGGETWITDAQTRQDQFFTFRQYFDLTGFDPRGASLTFSWGCDDVPTGWPVATPAFSVNGGAFQGQGTCNGYAIGSTPVSVTSGFVAGRNYIDFRVQGNYATNGMGLRVASFTADPGTPVPEPGTMALLAGGLLCLGLRRRNRRR